MKKMPYLLVANQVKKILFSFSAILLFCSTSSSQTCDTWLHITGDRSCVDIGEAYVDGQYLTVECLFNTTAIADPIAEGGGDLVSKHAAPFNINYLLRPNAAKIGTSNGFFEAKDYEPIALNTTYHVALVYNGSSIKLYRNGILKAETAATGNLTPAFGLRTIIGRTADLFSIWPTDFIGYINEVRIWDIERSQTEIQTFMNTFLPNPENQAGLKCYYTFNSLSNKAANISVPVNASFIGPSASIGASNPNPGPNICVAPIMPLVSGSDNTFLIVNSNNSGVTIGELGIPGDQLTIEAVCTRTEAYPPLFGGGDLVSKHCNPSDASYFLRPNQAGIRTNNGLFIVDAICPIELNQTYHVAMVYDGSSLKLYRNSELVGATPATGNISTNSFTTHIGSEGCVTANPAGFIGHIDEVRIWNSARSYNALEFYKFKRLRDPQNQPGLLAYYTFNSLTNLQGTAAYNGSITGSASINQVNAQYDVIGWNCECISCRTTDKRVKTAFDSTLNIVFPNPAVDYIRFNSNSNGQAFIINSSGGIVNTFKVNIGTNRVYVGNLSKGPYFLRQLRNGKLASFKFIKL